MTRSPSPTRMADLLSMESHAEEAARLLRSLGNPNRLMVLCALSAGEMSVGELNAVVPLSQSALSQHLAVLREDSLVTSRRDGHAVFYSVPDGPALRVLEVLYGTYCATPAAASAPKSTKGASK
ncbi:MAG TPA: metalloregulator ArsR/SmtB family transcription factor [Moraxellaceae bacterium]|nr:metalloregulator ArsR/SmtB family transcription factor [Moraxellaceae bacterium]